VSRAAPPTAEELSAAFDDLLNNPNPGAEVPTDTGLDDETTYAIERVWAAGPDPSPALIAAARQELALQLDGTHAAEGAAREAAIFDQVAEDREDD
jgi:hypothetical protein